MYRSASFWTSAYAPEISMGMRTVEEVEDTEYVELKKEDNEQSSIEQIKAEREKRAGKNVIELKAPAADVKDDATPANVDPETGEVYQENEEPAKETSAPAY